MPTEPIQSFSDCDSFDDVKQAFTSEIAGHGFTVCACGAFVPTDTGPETHFFFQNWPADWLALYQEQNFVAVDFSVAEARRRISPFTWREALATRVLSRSEASLWDRIGEWGWEDGFSVPIHGPGGYFGLVTMGGPAQVLPPALRNRLQILSFQAHERCRQLAGISPIAPAQGNLTVRELECLRWVASGKTDWEISQILGLSASTVKTHVDQARVKLNARSRSQAVARMVLAGLS